MNVRHLQHLLAVAEAGSFSRAAEKLFLTQSALSRSIQALEEEIDGKVLDRVGKRSELTPLGHLVLERAKRIVLEASELCDSAALMRQASAGVMRIGLGSGPGAILGTPLMCHVARHYPQVRVQISHGQTELQLGQLRRRELDALVVDLRRVPPDADLSIQPIGDMEAGWIVRAGHPLLAGGAVSMSELLAYPIATTPLSDEVARLLVERYGEQANPARFTSLQCDDVESLLVVSEQTDAIFLGVVAAARERLDSGKLVLLQTRPALKASARYAYVTLRGRTEAPVMNILREFIALRMVDREGGNRRRTQV